VYTLCKKSNLPENVKIMCKKPSALSTEGNLAVSMLAWHSAKKNSTMKVIKPQKNTAKKRKRETNKPSKAQRTRKRVKIGDL